jgi:phage repressor protein C with HTH and peptisase S24 domain
VTFSLLQLALPGRDPAPAGVVLVDEENGQLGVKMRRDWVRMGEDQDLEEEDVALLAAFEGEIKRRAAQMGAGPTLAWLEETLSNVLRLGSRQDVALTGQEESAAARRLGFEFTLHRLYRECVNTIVEPFVTHLPRYSLRSAAGPFGAEMGEAASEVEDWVEAPAGLRLTQDMFVAEVAGESMQPLIPSGSLCVFRRFRAGSRNGLKVLVEDRAGAAGARYTVKIYRSEKVASDEDTWTQLHIRLESLNPAFAPIELTAETERFAVVAEFVSLLDA